ncbi:MAG: four helix bundle protein [Acidobacteria bacterium]|nr:MAG: four helix bundle protein [Acidobacteriota bacterium]
MMEPSQVRDHRKLEVFQLADDLVIMTYLATRRFPQTERYGLSSQLRRSAVSVAANIVEGCGRRTGKDYLRFLYHSFGSLREVGYYIDLARRLAYLEKSTADQLHTAYRRTSAALAALIHARQRE